MGNDMTGQWSRETKRQYSKVSQGNKETYRKEKMAKELGSKGFNHAAVAGMMGITESSAKTMMKKGGSIKTDGRL